MQTVELCRVQLNIDLHTLYLLADVYTKIYEQSMLTDWIS